MTSLHNFKTQKLFANCNLKRKIICSFNKLGEIFTTLYIIVQGNHKMQTLQTSTIFYQVRSSILMYSFQLKNSANSWHCNTVHLWKIANWKLHNLQTENFTNSCNFIVKSRLIGTRKFANYVCSKPWLIATGKFWKIRWNFWAIVILKIKVKTSGKLQLLYMAQFSYFKLIYFWQY